MTPPVPPAPPVAPRRPFERERFGEVVSDDLAWTADHDDPALLATLEAENAYAEAVLAPLAPLAAEIVAEIRARTQETDLSVPWRKGTWWYYARTVEGLSYPIHCRRPDDGTGAAPAAGDGAEEVLLDENALAEGHDHLELGVLDVSPDGWRLAYSVDHRGDEHYELRVRDLRTGEDLPVAIPDTSYGFAWAADSSTIFRTGIDPAERPHRVLRHRIGHDRGDGVDDEVVFEEPDARFHVSVGASRSGDLVAVTTASKRSTEVWLVDAHDPTTPARVVEPRRDDHEYHVAHRGGELFVLSNHDAPDFALWRTPLATPGQAHWAPLLPAAEGVRLDGVEAFRDHLVVHVRRRGVPGLHVVDLASGHGRDLTFDEDIRSVGPGTNEEAGTTAYRFGFQSLTSPAQVLEEDLRTGQRRLLKEQPVPGGFDRSAYVAERVWAAAPDGTEVPVSVVRRREVPVDGSAPCLLYGYGAYEIPLDPWFSVPRLSLLDRGVVVAIAHVRGGGELGRAWYEGGRLLAKPHSFTDFVAAADHLVTAGLAHPGRLVAMGGSAGGLLVGAATNLAPDRFRVVLAEVPFVDALNTILDPDLPLTVTEWEEWGNPTTDEAAYRVMRSYSPCENVQPVPYPAVLATAGLHDPRVEVHEPLKWVQRLREVSTATAERPVLLVTEMGAGHGGPSGRYAAWEHIARLYAFALDQVGATGRLPDPPTG